MPPPPYVANYEYISEALLEFAPLKDDGMWKFTKDIDDGFEHAYLEACKRHSWEPVEMLKCWNSESSLMHAASNPGGSASGLFQLMPDTAKGLGWAAGDSRWAEVERIRHKLATEAMSPAERTDLYQQVASLHHLLMVPYTRLTASQQLEWAEKFYGPKGPLQTAAACYVSTFLPALLKHANEPLFVLCAKHGPFASAYDGNKGAFDPHGRGYITVQDITDHAESAAIGPRWEEMLARLKLAKQVRDTDPEIPGIALDGMPDLCTTAGCQEALERLGYPTYSVRADGAGDGIWGLCSRTACRTYQYDQMLERTGQPDKATQAALLVSLQTAQ